MDELGTQSKRHWRTAAATHALVRKVVKAFFNLKYPGKDDEKMVGIVLKKLSISKKIVKISLLWDIKQVVVFLLIQSAKYCF